MQKTPNPNIRRVGEMYAADIAAAFDELEREFQNEPVVFEDAAKTLMKTYLREGKLIALREMRGKFLL